MSTFIDLSGTAELPAVPELREGAAMLLKCSSRAGESIRQAHSHWSLLAAAYAAPEQHLVHAALDGPRVAGESVLESAVRAAAALETFAAAVDGIRRKRLALQGAVEDLQAEERLAAGPVLPLLGENSPETLPGHLLQAEADRLAADLASAEDECIRILTLLAGWTIDSTTSGAGVYSDTRVSAMP